MNPWKVLKVAIVAVGLLAGCRTRCPDPCPTCSPLPPTAIHAGISVHCKDTTHYLDTGTSGGQCEIHINPATNKPDSGHCVDGANTAEASCAPDNGRGSCIKSTGSGTCVTTSK